MMQSLVFRFISTAITRSFPASNPETKSENFLFHKIAIPALPCGTLKLEILSLESWHRTNRPWAGYRSPSPPRGNFVQYDFLKLHYIRHKIKDVSPLRVAALTCNSTLYTLPPKIALNVPDNVSTMTCSYIFACWHRFMNFLWHSYIFLVLIFLMSWVITVVYVTKCFLRYFRVSVCIYWLYVY